VATSNGRSIASVTFFSLGKAFAQHDRESEANARLIAAAPALLEALQAMVDEQVEYMTINHLGDPEKQHNIKRARAAIALAQGEQS
jgi:hypothetical protein